MSSSTPFDKLSRPTRRALLQRFGALGLASPALSGLGGLGLSLAAMGQASAATGSGYRALVCVFLYGGNDAYNMVLATDAPSWTSYTQARAANGGLIALAGPGVPKSNGNGATTNAKLGGVLPIVPRNPQGRALALHPVMGEMADLFGRGKLAVMSNVGPLSGPTTKAAYLDGSAARPPKLFSHNDQQSTWQALSTEGATRGWGGRMADLLLAGNQRAMFSAISANGNAVWVSGGSARPYQLATTGAIRIGDASGNAFGSAVAQQKMLALMSSTRGSQTLESEFAATVGRSMAAEGLLRGALPGATAGPWGTSGLPAGQIDPLLMVTDPVSGVADGNPLSAQFQVVARMIAARSTLGMSRQVFFVGLPGFDTHDAQPERHALCLAQLSQGMAYFDRTLTQMGISDSVTTFTASDFGRNFSSNGEGCDHGWGAHHLVMGAGVKGGDVYGQLPVFGAADGLGGFKSPDQLANGALLPSTSVEAYAATMGGWMGLDSGQLLGILPNLGQWSPGLRNLGFMA